MIAVMGTARFAPGEIGRQYGVMAAMIAATCAEDGCVQYIYARDVTDTDRLIISELWRDEAALTAHFATPHMATLKAALGAATVLSLNVKRYEIANTAQLMGAD
jgi:quinol monooxygenase YgiN